MNKFKQIELENIIELRKKKYNPLESDINKPCIELEHFDQETGQINGFIPSLEQRSIKNVFYKGDILFGKLRPYLKKYWLAEFDGVCSSEVWVLKPKNNNIITKKFLFYLVQSELFIRIANISSGSKMPRADWDYISEYPFSIPSLEEQEKIAEILLSCDKAIRLTTQIITQLKQRNQGLAQQLLTGEKRIKGFENSVWKEVRLGKIGDTYNGLTGKSKEDFGEGKSYIPYLNIFSNHIVDSATFELVKIDIDDKQNKVIYGDILFTISSETPDEVGMSSVMLSNIDELYLNSFCFGFRLYNFDNLLPQYACYLFRNKDFRKEIVRLAQGSTRFNLSKSEFLKTRVFLPTLTEQNVIAQILDTAHQELKLYEQKLQVLQAQKKTLMQELLTGEILTVK